MRAARNTRGSADQPATRKRSTPKVIERTFSIGANLPGQQRRTLPSPRSRQGQPTLAWERERRGVTPADVLEVIRRLGWPEAALLKAIGLPQSSWSRKKTQGVVIDGAPGIAVLALQDLLAEARSVAKATVDADVLKGFDVDKWLGRWLQAPMPALAGQAPAELLDMPSGQAVVMQLLGSLESGAYQ